MKKYQIIIVIFLTLWFSTSCNPAECFKTAGEGTTEQRIIGNFSTLIVQDNIEVILENRQDNAIRLEGGRNLLKKISTETQGTVLTLSNENSCNWARKYENRVKIFIPAQNLTRLEQLGFATIHSTDTLVLKNDLTILCEGTGDIVLTMTVKNINLTMESASSIIFKGKANKSVLNVKGYGKISTENLRADTCIVNHESINNVLIFPINRLEATIISNGSVIYYNEPKEIIRNIIGKGQVFSK